MTLVVTTMPSAWEVELVVVIGQLARNVPEQHAWDHSCLEAPGHQDPSHQTQSRTLPDSRQVQELHRLGAPTPVIAGLVGRDPSLIRGDLRTLQQQIRPAV
jgi:hypothetical protein